MRIITICLLVMLGLQGCTYYLGNSRETKYNRAPIEWPKEAERTPSEKPLNEQGLIQMWAEQEMGDWYEKGKVHVPRVMIARLALGQDIYNINRILQSILPWGVPGTSSNLNPNGDYDFSEIPLCVLLYTFKDDSSKLYPETAQYIVDSLLVHSGGEPSLKAPRTIGIVKETENHIFMGETSRYLKNQWMYNHGHKDSLFNNLENGLEKWWLEHLQLKIETGMFEFNSDPYSGYSLTALMTLEAFAESDTIKKKVRELLDLTAWKYALGSLEVRRYPPMRRRLDRAGKTGLQHEPQTALMNVWLARYQNQEVTERLALDGRHHMLLATILPYQPNDSIMEWVQLKQSEYFVKMTHGYKACPEIYSGGPSYVLGGGGAQRSKRSQIVPRTITLLLRNGANDLSQCFYLKENGGLKSWNHTGIYNRFAVVKGTLHIPESYIPVEESGDWKLFKPYRDNPLQIVTYESNGVALIALFPYKEVNLLNKVMAFNKDDYKLKYKFQFPGGDLVEYDLTAMKSMWVIKAVNGEKVERKHYLWKQLELTIPQN